MGIGGSTLGGIDEKNPTISRDDQIEDLAKRGIYPAPMPIHVKPGTDIQIFFIGVPGSGIEDVVRDLQTKINTTTVHQNCSIETLSKFPFGGNNETPNGRMRPVEFVNLFESENIDCIPHILSNASYGKLLTSSMTKNTLNTASIFMDNPKTTNLVFVETLLKMGFINKAQHAMFQHIHRAESRFMIDHSLSENVLFVVLDTDLDTCKSELESSIEKEYPEAFDLFTRNSNEFIKNMRDSIIEHFERSRSVLRYAQLIFKTDKSYRICSNPRNFVVTEILKMVHLLSENVQHRITKSPEFHPFVHLQEYILREAPEAGFQFPVEKIEGIIKNFKRSPVTDLSEEGVFVNNALQYNILGVNVTSSSSSQPNPLNSQAAFDLLLDLQKKVGTLGSEVDTLRRATNQHPLSSSSSSSFIRNEQLALVYNNSEVVDLKLANLDETSSPSSLVLVRNDSDSEIDLDSESPGMGIGFQ